MIYENILETMLVVYKANGKLSLVRNTSAADLARVTLVWEGETPTCGVWVEQEE